MGEPAGIGPDLILRLYAERAEHGLPPFIVYGNVGLLEQRARRLGYDFAIRACASEEAGGMFATAMPVADVDGLVGDKPGQPSQVSAPLVINSIAEATSCVLRGACRALVTGPIHKAVLHGAGFAHPGHTEYLAELCTQAGHPARLPVMMLAHEDLRVVPLTIHVPLRLVPDLLTTALLVSTIRIVARDLKSRFGIAEPRIAVTGLNPHAGEAGSMGSEDLDVIGPAVAGLRQDGLDIEGPLPADTLFYPPHWRRYDAVVAMYHDQALIPIKTVAFEGAVNVTLGLPIVRTSPDHGTAFDLAGTGRGSAASFLAAIRMADRLTSAR